MNDSNDNSAGTSPAQGNQSNDPLAVLEDILKEAKAKKGLDGKLDAGGGVGADGAAGGSVPAQLTPEEIAAKEAQAKAEAEAQKIAEEAEAARLEAQRLAQVEAQRQQIEQEIKQSPQYQAAVQQEEDKQQAQTDAASAGEGFEIIQIDHDKI